MGKPLLSLLPPTAMDEGMADDEGVGVVDHEGVADDEGMAVF